MALQSYNMQLSIIKHSIHVQLREIKRLSEKIPCPVNTRIIHQI